MGKQFVNTILFLSLISLFLYGINIFISTNKEVYSISFPRKQKEAEDIFALGDRIELSKADDYSLSLIKGIPQKSINEILSKQKQLCRSYENKNKKDWEIFIEINGLGEKLSKVLSKYFYIEKCGIE